MKKGEYLRLQQTAQFKCHEAIRKGGLPAIDNDTKCAYCGETATMYDHRDYREPLEVIPTCRRCNRINPPALPPYDGVENHNQKRNGGMNDSDGVEGGANFSGIALARVNEVEYDDHMEYCSLFEPDPDVKTVAVMSAELGFSSHPKIVYKQIFARHGFKTVIRDHTIGGKITESVDGRERLSGNLVKKNEEK